MKTILTKAAALALVAGVAGIALTGTSSAERLKFNFPCNPDFTTVGGGTNYSCAKTFVVMCKDGTDASNPVLTHVSGKKWKISYTCVKPPA
jgi:hypothetical protein